MVFNKKNIGTQTTTLKCDLGNSLERFGEFTHICIEFVPANAKGLDSGKVVRHVGPANGKRHP